MFTTPPRPIDVIALFPEIAGLARTATRLHPRRGTPQAHQSSVAGPMLWPVDEPWPTCWLPHLVEIQRPMNDEEQALWRLADEQRAAAAARHANSPMSLRVAAAFREEAATAGADPGARRMVHTWEPAVPPQPVRLLPVLQLFAADAPQIAFPRGTDLLQLLWCPFRHQEAPGQKAHYNGPAVHLLWRSAGELDTVATNSDPGPEGGYVLQPCVLHPEQITEYPDIEDRPEPLQSRVLQWEELNDDDPFSDREPLGYDYRSDLSTATGLKVGGWPYWPHCPRPIDCACGGELSLLLTMPNGERGAKSWTPLEEQHVAVFRADGHAFHDPTDFSGARDALMVFVCTEDPHHQPYINIE
jgi:hypothetical protein